MEVARVPGMVLQVDVPGCDGEPRVIAGKYRLEQLLGEGGMGSVWRAFNLQLELAVAIKLLRPGVESNELSERLRVEARAAAKLVSPSIVRVFDIGEAESGEPFIVMELLAGESLGDLLARSTLPAANAVQLLLPIAEGLTLAHSRGVIHRDLKPDNIFLTHEGDVLQPKLVDFGIAKLTTSTATGGVSLTQSGVLLGSPDYMSPEQASGRADIDERSDVWSFCVVLYEAISGATPFSGASTREILRSVLQDDPLPLDVLVNVDRRLSDIIQRGLAKDREQRPASIFELGQQLATWLLEQGIHEDAAGGSLETKWLGRATDTLCLTHPNSSRGPHAEHDNATLVSILHPRPQLASEPLMAPAPRRRRWVPSAIVLTAAVFGYVGWASLREFRTLQGTDPRVSAAPAATTELATRAVAVAVEPAAPAVPIEALAVEVPAPVAPAPAAARVGPPLAAPAAAPNVQAAASARSAPNVGTAGFPRKPRAHDAATELINPY